MDQTSVEPFDPDQYASWVKAAPQPDQQQTVEPFDPDQYASWVSGADEEQPSEPKTSMLGAAAAGAAHSLGPAAGAIAGAELGAGYGSAAGTAIAPGIGTVVGGLVGGLGGALVGGLGGAYAQRSAEQAVGLDKTKGILGEEYAQAAEKEHPYAKFAGELAPNLAAFEGASAKMAARLLSGGIFGATELGQEAVQGDVDPGKVLMSAGAGAFAPNPRPWLQKLTGNISQVGAGKLTGRNQPDTAEAATARDDVSQHINTTSENRGTASEAPTAKSEADTYPNPNYSKKRDVPGAAPQPDPESPGINTGPDETLKAATDAIEPVRAEPAAPAEPAPAPQAEQAAQPQEGGIPFVMTNDMKQRLGAAGKTPEEIYNMTPQQAHEFLNAQPAAQAEPSDLSMLGTHEYGGPKIDNTQTITTGANSANDGTVYIDKSIPELSPTLKTEAGEPLNLHQPLTVHETVEAANMDKGYDEAHKIALAAEKAEVEKQGGDWNAYSKEIDGYLSHLEGQKQEFTPESGFHVTPEEADGHHANKIGPEGTVEPEIKVPDYVPASQREAWLKSRKQILEYGENAKKYGLSEPPTQTGFPKGFTTKTYPVESYFAGPKTSRGIDIFDPQGRRVMQVTLNKHGEDYQLNHIVNDSKWLSESNPDFPRYKNLGEQAYIEAAKLAESEGKKLFSGVSEMSRYGRDMQQRLLEKGYATPTEREGVYQIHSQPQAAQPIMQAMKRGPRLPGQTGTPKTVEDLEAASKNLLKAIGEKIPEQPKAAEEAINAGAKLKNVAPPLVQNAVEKAVNNSLPAKLLAIRGRGTPMGRAANFIMRSAMGEAKWEERQFNKGLEPLRLVAEALPPEVNRDFQISMQTGKPVNEYLPQLQPLADFFKGRNAYWKDQIKQRQMLDEDEFQENYWRQAWLNKPEEINQAWSVWHTGNKSALKEKVYPTIPDGEKAGLTLNPDFIQTQVKLEQSNRLLKQLNDILADAKDQGILRDKPAFGLTKLIAKGLNGREYFAPDDFARNFNRYHDPGFYTSEAGGKLYDIVRRTNGMVTAVKLALPVYHLSTMAGESMIGKMASSFYNAAAGDFGTAVKRFASIPAAPATYFKESARYLAEYDKPGTDPDKAVQTAVKLYRKVNGAFAHDIDPTVEYVKDAEAWSDAWRRGGLQGILKDIRQNVGQAEGVKKVPAAGQEVFRALGRTMQEAAKPLFQVYIPRLKLGMAMENLTDFIHAHPELDSEKPEDFAKLQNVAMKIADSMDNRAGLMVHDNIFMPRMIKQLGTAFMTSYSWATGTFGEVAGGAFGLANHPSRLNIRNPEFDPRAAYMAAFPVYFGLLASIYQYMKTGKAPWDTETPGADLVAGRTGGTLKHGQPERAIFPGYLKDVLGWYHDPATEAGNKFSPMMKLGYNLMQDSGWIGGKRDQLISNPNHPFTQRAGEYFKYVANNLKPIYLEQQQQKKPGSNITAGEAAAAIRPAPPFVSGRNPAEYKYFERKWKERQKAERMAQ